MFHPCRSATVTVLANLVYTHYVHKVTQSGQIYIMGFNGSVSLSIQPVLLNTLVQNDDWVAVVRDKVMRYYHLFRPLKPKQSLPEVYLNWGPQLNEVTMSRHKGKLWYQLVNIGLTQWSYARVIEHISDLLKACAVLDGRTRVNVTDYNFLIRLLQPLQLERYIIDTYGFEAGRVFNNNLYCILVELASFGDPSIEQLCVDYKVSPSTAERLCKEVEKWCWLKANSPRKVMPTDKAKDLLEIGGVNQKW